MDGSAQHHLKLGEFSKLHNQSWLQKSLKRALDLSLAFMGIVFLSPVLFAIAVLVRLQDGGPSIFSHTRIGQNGKQFKCYKFRSMVIDAPQRLEKVLATDPDAAAEWARDQKLRKDPRITRLGSFLRRSSLDELPQLFNILRGEMSVVGPRPIVMDEIKRYGYKFEAYKTVRPGVTGLWQVSGRNDVSYNERVDMDARYAQEWTALGDIWIIIKTVPAVLLSRGAS